MVLQDIIMEVMVDIHMDILPMDMAEQALVEPLEDAASFAASLVSLFA